MKASGSCLLLLLVQGEHGDVALLQLNAGAPAAPAASSRATGATEGATTGAAGATTGAAGAEGPPRLNDRRPVFGEPGALFPSAANAGAFQRREAAVTTAWDLLDLPFALGDTDVLERVKQTGESEQRDDVASLLTNFLAGAFGKLSGRRAERDALESRDAGKPLIWLHIHKAGGTLMCQMAKLHEKVIAPADGNCNWLGHDGFGQSGQPEAQTPCAERSRVWRQGGYTYGQVERELAESEVCEEFRYGAMLREPVALMQSMLNYGIWYWDSGIDGASPTACKAKPDTCPLSVPPELTAWLGDHISRQSVAGNQFFQWVQFDNLQTRLLADALSVPAGQIGEEHVARARAFLQRHNFTVFVLEDMLTKGQELFDKLSWPLPEAGLHHKANQGGEYTRPFKPEEIEFLRDLNKYDYQLYESVRTDG